MHEKFLNGVDFLRKEIVLDVSGELATGTLALVVFWAWMSDTHLIDPGAVLVLATFCICWSLYRTKVSGCKTLWIAIRRGTPDAIGSHLIACILLFLALPVADLLAEDFVVQGCLDALVMLFASGCLISFGYLIDK